jgi:hypothetical protein
MKKLRSVLALLVLSIGLNAQVSVKNGSDGMKLSVNGKDFFVNGMNWDYFPIGTNYNYSLKIWELIPLGNILEYLQNG